MKPEVYAIREWLAFLANRQKRWDEANDLLLRQWRDSHHEALEAKKIEPRQVERKLAFVFNFYRLLPEVLPFDDKGQPRELFVGRSRPREKVTFPITSKILIDPKERETEVWFGAERVAKGHNKRPTPDEGQVGKILTSLRSKAERTTTRRETAHAKHWLLLEGERNWLVARCLVGGGLRAEEASKLSLDAVLAALEQEAIQVPVQAATSRLHALDAISGSPSARRGVLDALEALRARGRSCIYVKIIGKGRKTRQVPFAIDLVRDILEVGVWTIRHEVLGVWYRVGSNYPVPRELFLSFKTKERMKPGTIGDLVKDAFTAAGVPGSAHRLRAHFATMLARTIWDDCFALNGYRFDQTVVNMALDRIAEALGHSSVTTTVRYYLDMALLRHFGIGSRGKLDAVRNVWDMVVKRQDRLSKWKLALICKVIDGLAEAPDGSVLEHVITMAVADESMNPLALKARQAAQAPEKTKRQPNLRVVD